MARRRVFHAAFDKGDTDFAPDEIELSVIKIASAFSVDKYEASRRIFLEGILALFNSPDLKGQIPDEMREIWNERREIMLKQTTEDHIRFIYRHRTPEEFNAFCGRIGKDPAEYRRKYELDTEYISWTGKATQWLKDLLSDEKPRETSEIIRLGQEAGVIQDETSERDWDALRVIASREHYSSRETKNVWSLANKRTYDSHP